MSSIWEIYFLLFVDSFVASMVLPLNRILAFRVMHIFGGYNDILMIITASIGAAFGGMVNWYFGRIIIFARMEYHKTTNNILSHYNYIQLIAIFLVLLFSWVSFLGAVITIVSGYLKVKMRNIFVAVFISYLLYFTYITVVT